MLRQLNLAIKQRRRDSVEFLTNASADRVCIPILNSRALSLTLPRPLPQIVDNEGNEVGMVNPNARGPFGRTALYEACMWGDEHIVKLVLNYRQVSSAGWN